ncbi:hypothetical protein JOC37_002067 [Desulfohalotomaculum tongense]|nr:hypothetical protein [Desulforadius tongensis]
MAFCTSERLWMSRCQTKGGMPVEAGAAQEVRHRHLSQGRRICRERVRSRQTER